MSARNKARVSVIIPVFNNADTISDALHSAIDQRYPDMEIIVVDDGSTDGTSSVLETFSSQIKTIRQRNSGAGAARNAGLGIATGDYVAFLDADDIWLPDKLSKQIALLDTHPQIGLVCSLWRCWHPKHSGTFSLEDALASSELCKHSNLALSGWVYHKLLMDCHIWTSTVIMRRSTVDEVGNFDEELMRGQDYDYWLRICRKTQVVRIPEVLALYRMRSERLRLSGIPVDFESQVVNRAVTRWGLSSPNGASLSREAYTNRLVNLKLTFAYATTQDRQWRLALQSQCKALIDARWSPSMWPRVGRSFLSTARFFINRS